MALVSANADSGTAGGRGPGLFYSVAIHDFLLVHVNACACMFVITVCMYSFILILAGLRVLSELRAGKE